jgi:hypothetical protein
MTVNMKKTKVMVFRNGGPLRNIEKWYYRGEQVQVTSHYDYLGLNISCRMRWACATKQLALKACKAINMIRIFVSVYQCTNVTTLLSLFDKMILPVLLYGAEVWGTHYNKNIEKVQVKYCKYVLRVNAMTPDIAVLGECGRYPLFVCYYGKVI